MSASICRAVLASMYLTSRHVSLGLGFQQQRDGTTGVGGGRGGAVEGADVVAVGIVDGVSGDAVILEYVIAPVRAHLICGDDGTEVETELAGRGAHP